MLIYNVSYEDELMYDIIGDSVADAEDGYDAEASVMDDAEDSMDEGPDDSDDFSGSDDYDGSDDYNVTGDDDDDDDDEDSDDEDDDEDEDDEDGEGEEGDEGGEEGGTGEEDKKEGEKQKKNAAANKGPVTIGWVKKSWERLVANAATQTLCANLNRTVQVALAGATAGFAYLLTIIKPKYVTDTIGALLDMATNDFLNAFVPVQGILNGVIQIPQIQKPLQAIRAIAEPAMAVAAPAAG
jgi:hypothetical protein